MKTITLITLIFSLTIMLPVQLLAGYAVIGHSSEEIFLQTLERLEELAIDCIQQDTDIRRKERLAKCQQLLQTFSRDNNLLLSFKVSDIRTVAPNTVELTFNPADTEVMNAFHGGAPFKKRLQTNWNARLKLNIPDAEARTISRGDNAILNGQCVFTPYKNSFDLALNALVHFRVSQVISGSIGALTLTKYSCQIGNKVYHPPALTARKAVSEKIVTPLVIPQAIRTPKPTAPPQPPPQPVRPRSSTTTTPTTTNTAVITSNELKDLAEAVAVVSILIPLAILGLMLLMFSFWIFTLVKVLTAKHLTESERVPWTMAVIFLFVLGSAIYWLFGPRPPTKRAKPTPATPHPLPQANSEKQIPSPPPVTGSFSATDPHRKYWEGYATSQQNHANNAGQSNLQPQTTKEATPKA